MTQKTLIEEMANNKHFKNIINQNWLTFDYKNISFLYCKSWKLIAYKDKKEITLYWIEKQHLIRWLCLHIQQIKNNFDIIWFYKVN